MAGCERGGRMDLAEHPGHKIDEYSLTYSGPSELCLGVLEVAGELGHAPHDEASARHDA